MSDYTKYGFQLVDVPRFSGKTLNCKYSVGEHSFRVTYLALAIVDQYNIENPNNTINVETVLRKSIIHDVEESITGDIPSPVKKINNLREELRAAGTILMKDKILHDCPNPKYYLKMWEQDKKGKTGEVIIVADKLEGMLASYYEVKNGNRSLTEAFVAHLDWFCTTKGKNLLTKYSFARNEFMEVASFVVKEENMKNSVSKENLQKLKNELTNIALK